MGWRTLCLALLCCLTGTLAQVPKCVLIAPSVLRVDTEETLVLTVHGAPSITSKQDDQVQIWDFPLKRKELAKAYLPITYLQNDAIQSVKLKVSSSTLEKQPNKKQFVAITVKFGPCKLEKVVLVSFQSGYVFIQTDKPLYTPGSKLYYRLFTMSPDLDPESKPVTVEFRNPDNIIVQRDEFLKKDPSGIMSKSYTLSEPARTGIWTMTASYKDNPSQNFTTNFEVKEYVLPSFEIKLQPRKKFFYYKDNDFKVDIVANFLFGKTVSGVAFVLFGVRRGDQHVSLPGTLKRIPIINGVGEVKLERKDLLKKFSDERSILGWTLHMQVSCVTDTGSDLVEAELDDIHIVESPYKIAFSKTSEYFKPGLPFDVTVLVTNPDGSPASKVSVIVKSNAKDTDKDGITNAEGKAKITINPAAGLSSITINALTKETGLNSDQQAKASMTATAYNNGRGNFLHISVQSTPIALYENMQIQFSFKRVGENYKEIKHIFYLIQNKGRILTFKKLKLDGQSIFMEPHKITPNFLPSVRIVAFYVIGDETVADSLWVDVKDECAGKLELEPNSINDKVSQKPSTVMKLKMTADYKAYVGLVAVDKAVFALNNKFRLTQSKVWDWIEKYDPGCTAGGGRDMKGVFFDAGLALHSNFEVSTLQRIDPTCQSPERKIKRRRRDTAMMLQFKNEKALTYVDQDRRCCFDGMKQNPMGLSCEQRSKYIELGQTCINAFLDCCKYMEKKKQQDENTDSRVLDRSDVDEEYFDDEEDVRYRSKFPESFLWETKFMDKETTNGIATTIVNVNLPDSITTWEVMAVSLSKGNGLCVSKPYEILVQKDVFIDLKLPYSVYRNEQVEIRAVIYNYLSERITANVVWSYNEKFCSRSTSRKNYRERVVIDPQSSVSVPHVIIPLDLNPISVEVKVYGSFAGDGVTKILRVMPEGKFVEKRDYVILDPEQNSAKRQEVHFIPEVDSKNVVPNSDVQTMVTVQGTPISDMIQQAIDGVNLDHLINMPMGCGEQNMMRLTSVVIATHYLDTTNQWDRIGVDRRAQAIQYIMTGISQQSTYRSKEEPAFAGYSKTIPSTWLTAYVVRVFILANNLTDIGQDQVCESVKWLVLRKQKPDGLFVEDGIIFGTYMMGGIDKDMSERDSTLTAFVLIALLDSQNICSGHLNNLPTSIKKAYSFVKEYYRHLTRPYSIAITSYALAKAGQLDNLDTLMSAAKDGNHWPELDNREVSIEATSYALLTLLKKGEYKKAEPVVKWLTAQRFYGYFYGSTQATIMMFQALAEYQAAIPPKKNLNITVEYILPEKNDLKTFQINPYNAPLARSEVTKGSGNFTIVASGTGKGLLTVTTTYYEIKTEEEKECKNFELNVAVKKEKSSKRSPKPTVSIDICTKFKGTAKPGMCIIDVSMLTGYSAQAASLDALQNNVDKYISQFEINKAAYNQSAVVFYVDKISNTQNFCISFKAEAEFNVDDIQPASVTVYEYYAKENRCTKYYHVDEESKLLSKICHKDVCHCAENSCYKQQQLTRVKASDRYADACKPDMDYVYRTTLSEIQNQGQFNIYVMTITDIIKPGTDGVAINEKRKFFSHTRCEEALNLKKGQDYIIWGLFKDMTFMGSEYTYMITKDSWVELWPTARECQEQYQNICQELFEFEKELKQNGCDD